MERIVVTCDFCGKEVESTGELKRIDVKVKTCFGYIMDSPLNGDACVDCYNQLKGCANKLKGKRNDVDGHS